MMGNLCFNFLLNVLIIKVRIIKNFMIVYIINKCEMDFFLNLFKNIMMKGGKDCDGQVFIG